MRKRRTGWWAWLLVALGASAAGAQDAPRVRFPQVARLDRPVTAQPVAGTQEGWRSVEPQTVRGPAAAVPAVPPSSLSGFDPYHPAAAGGADCGPQPAALTPGALTQQLMPQTRRFPPFRLYGDFLFWRPGDAARTKYALPVNGAVLPIPNPPVPAGNVAELDPSYDPGFRVGMGFRTSPVSQWDGVFTYLQSEEDSAVAVNPAGGIVLRSLVVHPSTPAAQLSFRDASAVGRLDLILADLEYRRIVHDGWYYLALLLGGRYASLEQDFSAAFSSPATTETVTAQSSFQGGGIRVGLEGEWRGRTNFFAYSRGSASFLAGRYDASFAQTNSIVGPVAVAGADEDRIVPTVDLELGVGWRSATDRFRISAGYAFAAWYNVISTGDFIRGVQSTQYDGINDTLTFDGLVARGELRF